MEALGAPKRETFVKFLSPDGMFSKSKSYPVEHRDPYKIPTTHDVLGIQFYDVISQEIQVGDDEIVLLKSGLHNPSPLYFLRGKLLHITEIEQQYPTDITAIANMRKYEKNRAVKFGTFYAPFEPTDKNQFLKDYISRTHNGEKPEGDERKVE